MTRYFVFGVGALILIKLLAPEGLREITGMVQPPVQLTLTKYLIENGYYVNVQNLSDKTLVNVTVTYLWQGNSKDQWVGILDPWESMTIDPDREGIRVQKNEHIRVSSDGYVPKTIETNTLINQ